MTDLERQCEEIANDVESVHFDWREDFKTLIAYITELKAEIAELRKPVPVEVVAEEYALVQEIRNDPIVSYPHSKLKKLLKYYDQHLQNAARDASARDALMAEIKGLRERMRLFDECNEYWQARFNVLTDAWNSGNNDAVLDACRRFVKANDDAPARAKLEEIRGLRERLESAFDELSRRESKIIEAGERERKLREALQWYADPNSWIASGDDGQCRLFIAGDIAQGGHGYEVAVSALAASAAQATPKPISKDLRDYGYAQGNYTSHCITCDQIMDFVDKRCRCCEQCATKRRDSALAASPAPTLPLPTNADDEAAIDDLVRRRVYDKSIADIVTQRSMEGTWTLTAPDGRQWQAESPLKCCKAEMDERVPADIALARIMREAAVPVESDRGKQRQSWYEGKVDTEVVRAIVELKKLEHVCGKQGFGRGADGLNDRCEACERENGNV